MFNKKQIDDVIKNERKDVAAGIFEQMEKLADAQERQEEFYESASIETLRDLVENGDDEACSYYINKRIHEDQTLDWNDIEYLDLAIKNLNYSASLIGAYIYGLKDSRFKDVEKEFFSYAVCEQYTDSDAHKQLDKAYKKNSSLIEEVDKAILSVCLDRWAASTLKGEKYFSFTAQLNSADKSSELPDWKSAYVLEIYLTHENGRESDPEELYIAYIRGKDKDGYIGALCNNLAEILSIIAQKTGLSAGDIYVDGKKYFHYGASASAKKSAVEDSVKIVSDANLKVNVSDEGRLKSNICSYCGGATDFGGVCSVCGKRQKDQDDGSIVIRKGKNTEALRCTQCGSPIKLEDNCKTAYCSACGTTFAVNGSALTDGVFGLNYENIRADMPEGAQLPPVEFVRASIVEGAITAIMPRNFIVMSDEIRKIKYPVNAPKYIYTTPDTTVNLNINITGALQEKDVFDFGRYMLTALKSAYSTAKFGEAKMIDKPRKVFFIDFITAGMDQSIYNAMFFFSYNGKQGIGSWNCLGKDRWFWAPIFEHAVRTMEFK
ncbi:MAG: hypothetical protein K2L70_01440 [Clostridia bacterium]|nr:hypothetical protein [Clostridia bacterium]